MKDLKIEEINQLATTKIGTQFSIRGTLFETGTVVSKYPSGSIARVVQLNADTLANGVLFKKGTSLYFHPNGEVMQGTLARNETLAAFNHILEFKALTNLRFNDYGEVSSGHNVISSVLSPPYNFNITEGLVQFDYSGALIMCVNLKSLKVENKYGFGESKENSQIQLSGDQKNPSLTGVIFKKETKWGDLVVSKDKLTHFFSGGRSLLEPAELLSFYSPNTLYEQGFFIDNSEIITLHQNGTLHRFNLGREINFNNIELKPNLTVVYLHDNSNLKQLFSSHSLPVEGADYPPYTRLNFDREGKLITE
jgi:hypothetical protein